MVIGWLSPVVLVPASILSSLPPDQLRSILAHEIAHVHRHDYLVNGLQKIVEAVLFFHPAVWWLSRQVRAEREQCCDDEAVLIAGDALVYANALYQLETIRAGANPIAMSANGGSIMQRIKRILESNATDSKICINGSKVRASRFSGLFIRIRFTIQAGARRFRSARES